MCGPFLGDAKNGAICDAATSCFPSYYMFIKSWSCPLREGWGGGESMGGNVGYLIAPVSIRNRLELCSWSYKTTLTVSA